ncbi:repressor LexA [candidate division KSB1 bacterium RBG_16_48_16]|nr:MAG: repressor LexA [candidate division KSB1 bacterium RBG_16_48_16]
MNSGVTEKQGRVLEAIRQFQAKYGYPPTVRELADIFGHTSAAGIHKILTVLKDKGYISKAEKNKSRSLCLVNEADNSGGRAKAYPIVGSVVAGLPELAHEEKEGELILDAEWAGDGDTFILRVKGHSMVDADIHHGDMLLVEKTQSCHNGEIVIALLDDEATVKRFFKERDRIRLQPENPAMHPIYVDKDDPNFRILGRVKGLLRKM